MQHELFDLDDVFMFGSDTKGMNYTQAKLLLGARSKVLLQRDTFLVKHKDYIALTHWRNPDLMRYYSDGRVVVTFRGTPVTEMWNSRQGGYERGHTGFYTAWTERDRVKKYLPYQWSFFSYRYHTMIAPIVDGKIKRLIARECPTTITFREDGSVHYPKYGYKMMWAEYGRSFTQLQVQYDTQDLLREKPRRRGRYWILRARNLYRKRCHIKPSWKCDWMRTRTNVPTTYPCGCVTYRKNIKFTRTVNQILDEPNATVRTAMIKLYGVQKFFKDAKARTLHERGDYRLLELVTGTRDAKQDRSVLVALQMKCPSTGEIYVNLVPEQIMTVPNALDWIYNTRDYFNTVGQQT